MTELIVPDDYVRVPALCSAGHTVLAELQIPSGTSRDVDDVHLPCACGRTAVVPTGRFSYDEGVASVRLYDTPGRRAWQRMVQHIPDLRAWSVTWGDPPAVG